MKSRDLKRFCKECGTRYNTEYVIELATQTAVHEGFTSIKAIKPFLGSRIPTDNQMNAIKEKRLPAFKIGRKFFSFEFELMVPNPNGTQSDEQHYIVVTAEGQNTVTSASATSTSIPDGNVSLNNFYSDEQLRVADEARRRLEENASHQHYVYNYHSGKYLYCAERSYGVRQGGRQVTFFQSKFPRGAFESENDSSYTMSAELEIAFDRRHSMKESEMVDLLNKYSVLGHFETDGSVPGVEFDFHPYTYQKLQDVKPVVTAFLNEMNNLGFRGDYNTGIHVHIGRKAFKNEIALAKFYYLLNCNQTRTLWQVISDRMASFGPGSRPTESTAFSYCRFNNSVDEARTLRDVQRILENETGEHSVACNLQHADTVEIRIFRSSTSAKVFYDYIQLIKNLADLCNDEESNEIKLGYIVRGTGFATGFFNANTLQNAVDVSFINGNLSPEELYTRLGTAMNQHDSAEIIRLTNLIQNAQRNGGNE